MVSKIQDAIASAFVLSAVEGGQQDLKSTASDNVEIAPPKPRREISLAEVDHIQPKQAKTLLKKNTIDITQNANTQEQKGELGEQEVKDMTKELNKVMKNINCNLEFQYHKEVNVMSVRIIDRETEDVIREYPPEDMIRGMIKAREWLGAFLDKNA